MQKITSIAGLKEAIQILEDEQVIKKQQLKEQFLISYESLKPLNLLKNKLNDIATSPNLLDNILGTLVGLASGYVSKKIYIGASGNIIRKLFGSVLQFGVTNVVANHPDAIKSFGQFIIEHLLRKKERISS